MVCEDCRKPAKHMYWLESLGSLVCEACLPKDVRPMDEAVIVQVVIPVARIDARQQAMKLETKAK